MKMDENMLLITRILLGLFSTRGGAFVQNGRIAAEPCGRPSNLARARGTTSSPSEARLKAEHHIYMLANGRISLAGLNSGNTQRFALALAEILGTN